MEDGYQLVDKFAFDGGVSYALKHNNNNRLDIYAHEASKRADIYINKQFNNSYYYDT